MFWPFEKKYFAFGMRNIWPFGDFWLGWPLGCFFAH